MIGKKSTQWATGCQKVAKRCADNLRRIDILGKLAATRLPILLPETISTAPGAWRSACASA